MFVFLPRNNSGCRKHLLRTPYTEKTYRFNLRQPPEGAKAGGATVSHPLSFAAICAVFCPSTLKNFLSGSPPRAFAWNTQKPIAFTSPQPSFFSLLVPLPISHHPQESTVEDFIPTHLPSFIS
jgi:hypothetical protein